MLSDDGSSTDDRNVTLRRSLEQAIHCLTEAYSVLKNKEDARCANDDVWQAQELIRVVIQPGVANLVLSRIRGFME
jgi:hypothetical protein